MKNLGGFTLLELMIVVAVVAIIAAVAIPSLSASRRAANEASTISMFRTGFTMNEVYRQRFGTYADGPEDWVVAGLIASDDGMAIAGGPQGYDFDYLSSGDTYRVTASPDTPGQTGDRSFYMDHSGVIRFSSSGSAGPADPPIQ